MLIKVQYLMMILCLKDGLGFLMASFLCTLNFCMQRIARGQKNIVPSPSPRVDMTTPLMLNFLLLHCHHTNALSYNMEKY